MPPHQAKISMQRRINLVNQPFGRLTAINFSRKQFQR